MAALVVIAVAGVIAIQWNAVSHGVVVDLGGTPTALTTPRAPWLQTLALTVVLGLAMWLLAGHRRLRTVPLLKDGFIVGATVAIVAFLWRSSYPYEGEIAVAEFPTLSSPVVWLRAGAMSPASWTLVACLLVVRLGELRGARRSPAR
ncbi:MAG: hypothetical protein ACLFWR_14295 [Acidimicrobiales bacterium]